MTVHEKLLMKWKVLNQIWWSWCYYINEEKMLYPARWKKITVSQSKFLKNRLLSTVPFFCGPPGIWHTCKTSRGLEKNKLIVTFTWQNMMKNYKLIEFRIIMQRLVENKITACIYFLKRQDDGSSKQRKYKKIFASVCFLFLNSIEDDRF